MHYTVLPGIGKAKTALSDMKNLLLSRGIKLTAGLRVLSRYVWSVLLYGCNSTGRDELQWYSGLTENDGHEVDGRENAGHVSGVWIGLHGIDFDLAECTVLFRRHLIFLDIHILDIFVDTWYSCVLVPGYAFQLFYNYRRSVQLTSLLWLVFCRCFEKNCTLHCNVIYFQTIYILSSNFMSVIFSAPGTAYSGTVYGCESTGRGRINLSFVIIIIITIIIIIERTVVERTLVKTIRQRQLAFLGHVLRTRGLQNLMVTGRIEGRRAGGRQRLKYLESFCASRTLYNDIGGWLALALRIKKE